jgi:hypothetical protein
MQYHFTFQFNDYKETLRVWDEWNMEDLDLEVHYTSDKDGIHIDSVHLFTAIQGGFVDVELVHILRAFGSLLDIKRAAESDQVRRNVEKMYKNYPDLAKPLTREEQAEILKLK